MKCYNCGKEMKKLKCEECNVVDYQCDCGWGSGHSHDHSEVIDSKDLGPTLSALYELDVVKQQLAEKDKEIEFLTKQNKALVEEEDLLGKKLKELGVDCIEDLYKISHQVCEEILNSIDNKFNCLGYISEMKFSDLRNYVLDQIEKGESK